MARKNRSNNSFAPIVITVLVAGVVGYYVIKDPPRSSQAGDGQEGRFSFGSGAQEDFQLDRSPDNLAAKAPKETGSKLDQDRPASENPLSTEERGGKLGGSASPAVPSASPEPEVGLKPDPVPPSDPNLSNADGSDPKAPAPSADGGEKTAPEPASSPQPEPKPATNPAPKPKPVASTEVYTVQDGDVIITIAEDWFGESGRHDEIIALNPGVDPTKLQIGQMLKMPRKNQPRSKPVDPNLAANEYRIAPNDNYTKIARLLLGDESRAAEIASLNPDLDPGNLQVGTVIKLPPKRGPKPEPKPVKRPPLRSGEKYYTVKSGDSLAYIVGEFWGVQREDWVEVLYQRNKETIGEDRTKLNLDQILIIPVKPKS